MNLPVASGGQPVLPGTTILELSDASPVFAEGGLVSAGYNLTLHAGECALVECQIPALGGLFADFCAGMIPLQKGYVKYLGLDWQTLDPLRANALRGRLGRISGAGGWIELYGTDLNILWPQLYHTTVSYEELVVQGLEASLNFGLPGLPLDAPDRISAEDRARAQCARAFLGAPMLLLLEEPVERSPEDLYYAFLNQVSAAQSRGAAILWFTRGRSVWPVPPLANCRYFRLDDGGLEVLGKG